VFDASKSLNVKMGWLPLIGKFKMLLVKLEGTVIVNEEVPQATDT